MLFLGFIPACAGRWVAWRYTYTCWKVCVTGTIPYRAIPLCVHGELSAFWILFLQGRSRSVRHFPLSGDKFCWVHLTGNR